MPLKSQHSGVAGTRHSRTWAISNRPKAIRNNMTEKYILLELKSYGDPIDRRWEWNILQESTDREDIILRAGILTAAGKKLRVKRISEEIILDIDSFEVKIHKKLAT